MNARSLNHFLLGLTVCLVFFASCANRSVYKEGIFKNKNVRYQAGELEAPWKKISVGGGDIAYVHQEDYATLLVNSECGKKYDAPLKALTYHLLIGMTDHDYLGDTKKTISGRSALISKHKVQIDGVKRSIKIMVLKRNRCVFDVVLTSPPASFEEHEKTFDDYVQAFDVEKAQL